ncbi:MAG TPA: pitrilysin family protein [Gemmatimonadaceae bacterium]|nr:pitrilysin family protein [Gemmatimonadaceae bacterium]
MHRSLRVLLVLLLLAPAGTMAGQSAPAGAASRLRVPVTVDTLPNGLTLIVHEDHSVPNVTTNVWYHVGSGDERPGRTGFAHLFEHLMFMGSENAPYPQFDRLLEAAGASNNGSTTEDRTNYFEAGPSNSLPLMLWLEADRMGWMLPTMDSVKVDLQRDVVKNERRQGVENQPYGIATDILPPALYPKDHPYSWPVIGSMTDLSAAALEDVKDFFRQYYAPNNATIVVAGAVQTDSVRRLVRQYFGNIPRGPAITRPAPASFTVRDTSIVAEDRVQLPRLYLAWHTVKANHRDDAPLSILSYLLTGARNSRLTNALVYQGEVASGVSAFSDTKRLDGDYSIVATARPGVGLDSLKGMIDRELERLSREGPTARELEQAKNATESSFLNALEFVSAKADQLNEYYYFQGTPDYFQRELDELRAVSAEDIRRVVHTYLRGPRVMLSIVPQGRRELAATRRVVQ